MSLHFHICIGVFLFHQFIKQFWVLPIFISSYLNDLLALPLYLSICLLTSQIIFPTKFQRLSTFQIILTCLAVSISFEVIFPIQSSSFKADYVDVICYAIGACYFAQYINGRLVARKYFEFVQLFIKKT